jgi:putative transposase
MVKQGATMTTRDGAGRTLWQRRFWEHTIRNEADYERHVDYIHYNPVKHGLVQTPADWPHSSLHRFIRLAITPPDWGHAVANDVDYGKP